MQKFLKKVVMHTILAGATGMLCGCTYGSISVSGDKAVITRNDMLLFGIFRKVYVCKVTEEGLNHCRSKDNP